MSRIGGYYPTALRATALGVVLGIGRLGGILGPTYGGQLIDRLSHGWQFHAYAIPALIGAIVVASVPRARARRVGSVTAHEQQGARQVDAGAGA